MTAHSAQQIAGGEAKRLEKCLDDRRCYEYAERALAFRNAHERKLVEQGKLSADFGNLTMDSFYGVPLINGKNIKPFVFRHRLYIAQRDVRRKTNEFEPPIEWIGVSRLDRIDANELRLADTCYLVVPHSDMED